MILISGNEKTEIRIAEGSTIIPSGSLNYLAPTIEEQILTENQYQTALLEMNMMGGM